MTINLDMTYTIKDLANGKIPEEERPLAKALWKIEAQKQKIKLLEEMLLDQEGFNRCEECREVDHEDNLVKLPEDDDLYFCQPCFMRERMKGDL